MAQVAAARSQEAAEAAGIPLQLDEEKLKTVVAVVRRHIQGLALTLEESGLWVASAVLQALLEPNQVNNLLDQVSAALDKTNQKRADSGYLMDAKDVAPAQQSDPVSPEVKAMHVGLQEVADILLSALPVDSQGILKIKQDFATLDPASPTFESSLQHVIKNTLLFIPGKLLDEHMLDGEVGVQLLDQELGIVGSNVHSEEGVMSQQQAKKAEQVMVKCEQAPQAQVPLFTAKTRALVQHLLQYMAVVAESKLISSASPAEANCPHWSCILSVTRKMTCLGLGALFEAASCLQPWSAATVMGYGSNTEAVKQTSTV